MKKTVLTFGLISGALSALMMFATLPFADRIGFDRGAYIGYTTIVLSALLVYFGIRSYRDQVGRGQIAFGRALAVGLLISLISTVCYVVSWEILYYGFMPDFMDKYAAHLIEKAKASGVSGGQLRQQLEQVEKARQLYANPLINAAITFIEPFPVFLVVTLLSSAFLRKAGGSRVSGI